MFISTVLSVSELWAYYFVIAHSLVGGSRRKGVCKYISCPLLIYSGNFLELTAQKLISLKQNLSVAEFEMLRSVREKKVRSNDASSQQCGSYRQMTWFTLHKICSINSCKLILCGARESECLLIDLKKVINSNLKMTNG